MLGHSGQDMDGKPVGVGHIGGDEVHTAFHQAGNEMDVAGKPIELGYHKRCLVAATVSQGPFKLGPVFMALTTFNFVILTNKPPAPARGESLHGLTLCFLS